jgi:hypothetical protein
MCRNDLVEEEKPLSQPQPPPLMVDVRKLLESFYRLQLIITVLLIATIMGVYYKTFLSHPQVDAIINEKQCEECADSNPCTLDVLDGPSPNEIIPVEVPEPWWRQRTPSTKEVKIKQETSRYVEFYHLNGTRRLWREDRSVYNIGGSPWVSLDAIPMFNLPDPSSRIEKIYECLQKQTPFHLERPIFTYVKGSC